MRFFGVLKRRIQSGKRGKIAYRHFRRMRTTTASSKRKYRNVRKALPLSLRSVVLSYQ